MHQVQTAPFQVTRIPGTNGEWIDLHMSQAGTVCLDTSGYVEVDPLVLIGTLNGLRETVHQRRP